MTTDFIQAGTRVVTRQIVSKGTETVLSLGKDAYAGSFTIVDLIISSTSTGHVTVLVRDNEHTHILVSLKGPGVFNHNFSHGWTFWKDSRLEVVKEEEDGVVDIACGYVKVYNNQTYDQWSRR